jgi:hypothetical protein
VIQQQVQQMLPTPQELIAGLRQHMANPIIQHQVPQPVEPPATKPQWVQPAQQKNPYA